MELKRIWKCKEVTIMPMIIGALGMVSPVGLPALPPHSHVDDERSFFAAKGLARVEVNFSFLESPISVVTA